MKFFIIFIIIVVLVGFFLLRSGPNEKAEIGLPDGRVDNSFLMPTTERGGVRAAVDFTLPNYAGELVSLADTSDKELLVLNFWASWCPFCVEEMPNFARLREEFSDKIVVVAVNRAESLNQAKKFSDQVGVTDRLVLLLDAKDQLFRAYGAFAMPTTYFIKDGQVADQKFGPMPLEEMRERVQRLLAKE